MNAEVSRALEQDRTIDITTTGRKSGQVRRTEIWFHNLDGRSAGAGQLFRTTLEKALFSSPVACLSTVHNRITRLEKRLQTDRGGQAFVEHRNDAVEVPTFERHVRLEDDRFDESAAHTDDNHHP